MSIADPLARPGRDGVKHEPELLEHRPVDRLEVREVVVDIFLL